MKTDIRKIETRPAVFLLVGNVFAGSVSVAPEKKLPKEDYLVKKELVRSTEDDDYINKPPFFL